MMYEKDMRTLTHAQIAALPDAVREKVERSKRRQRNQRMQSRAQREIAGRTARRKNLIFNVASKLAHMELVEVKLSRMQGLSRAHFVACVREQMAVVRSFRRAEGEDAPYVKLTTRRNGPVLELRPHTRT